MGVTSFLNAAIRSSVGSRATVFLRPSPCFSSVPRKMMSAGKMDHLQKTGRNYRQMALFPARVTGIGAESQTVRRLRLEVTDPDFSFRAGQWVDLFIPGVEKVGGFSICSAPGLLQREGVLELAVKYAQHPPAHWVHTQCALDSRVVVRVGGDFFFDPAPGDSPVDLLLVAGGVGINPLNSILQHNIDLLRHSHTHTHSQVYIPGHTHLCYSAKNTEELLFKSSIVEVCEEFPDYFSCQLHVTQQRGEIDHKLQPYTISERISEAELAECVNNRTVCFLCGPPPMIESVSTQLRALGLSEDRIRYEKWW
ncbi:oxidoreductase NAD-binding domain-containing protein 1-like isoform X2 [Denticeps clupeoides]|nr:oxidoreductase NAD-binding domain-containing protein 1-like isoform X2 [Denticeps clupeoides]XP_028847526.1 oxidoreductase NAD-binding domain-containing protein 1-like isoform X2 [Denticeps clupeoides]XP_028847527.1 oxidoreductase NAD-binding domain-containing protein 1-like isoform X2 [Denticeps clupeoides]